MAIMNLKTISVNVLNTASRVITTVEKATRIVVSSPLSNVTNVWIGDSNCSSTRHVCMLAPGENQLIDFTGEDTQGENWMDLSTIYLIGDSALTTQLATVSIFR